MPDIWCNLPGNGCPVKSKCRESNRLFRSDVWCDVEPAKISVHLRSWNGLIAHIMFRNTGYSRLTIATELLDFSSRLKRGDTLTDLLIELIPRSFFILHFPSTWQHCLERRNPRSHQKLKDHCNKEKKKKMESDDGQQIHCQLHIR